MESTDTSTEKRVLWSKALTLQLIELFRQQKCLWDRTHPDFTDEIKRLSAWEIIDDQMDIKTFELRQKIAKIVRRFRSEREKIKMHKSYVPCWFAYHHLLFLPELELETLISKRKKPKVTNIVKSEELRKRFGDEKTDENKKPRIQQNIIHFPNTSFDLSVLYQYNKRLEENEESKENNSTSSMPSTNNQQTCSICLKQTKRFTTLGQMILGYDKITIIDLLHNFYILNVSDPEDLSKVVCSACLSKIDYCYEFRKLCKENKAMQDNRINNAIKVQPKELHTPKTCTVESSLDPMNQSSEDFIDNVDHDYTTVINHKEETTINETDKNGSSCSQCDNLNQSPSLCQHKTLPNKNEQKFTCEFCDQTFRSKFTLNFHSKIHTTGVYFHKCNFCDAKFIRVTDLKIHKCTGPKHSCDYCDKTFNKRYELIIHKRKHMGDNKENCKICGKSFVFKESLTEHIKVAHTDSSAKNDLKVASN